MVESLLRIFKSMTKSLEVLYAIGGIKPVSRIIVDEDNLNGILSFLKENNAFSALSDFKIKKEVDENKYSNKGFRLDAGSEEKGQYFLYLSKDRGKSELAKKLEAENRHFELGRLLGYPECCCRFFEENFPTESKGKNDYVLASLEASDGHVFPFQTNIAIRHMDIALLSHFPCSFQCEESIKIADKNLEIVKNHSEEISTIFSGMLKGAVLYTEDKGIFLLRNTELNKNEVKFGTIMASMNNELYDGLKKATSLNVISKNHIKIGKKWLKGDDIGIMVFI